MFIDEPGLQFIFSSVSGYTDIMAREDFKNFFSQIERPRGIHLCGNPDWDFLLKQDMEILSFDAYRNGPIFTKYQTSIQKFLDRGGVLAWGLVPTQTELFSQESVPALIERLEGFWEGLYRLGFDREQLLAQSLLSRPPAVWSTPILKRPSKRRSGGSGKYQGVCGRSID